jgi:hypothetical protein
MKGTNYEAPAVLKDPQSISFLNVSDEVSLPYRTAGKILVLYILTLFSGRRLEGKDVALNGSNHISNLIR